MAPRRLLLAGSYGVERIPARPDPDDTRWFEPLHVRDEVAARERIAAQVEIGADVVVAPTWLTHRRALLELGETRQARAWTAAAVRVARDALEVGLERRDAALADIDDATVRARRSRPTPSVAASLPALGEASDPSGGRLLPEEAATRRDYRDQAGLLADAEPDLLLVEGQRSDADVRTAIEEAVSTGLPAWSALSGARSGADLERLLGWAQGHGIGCTLLAPPMDTVAPVVADAGVRWGGLADPASDVSAASANDVSAWLAAGASAIGLLDSADAERLLPLREAIDAHERTELEAQDARMRRWQDNLERVVSMAPGGAALWLGDRQAPLPRGFDWLEVGEAELSRLPHDHYRLIIDASGSSAAGPTLGPLLERGGIVLLPLREPLAMTGGLRLLSLDEATEPPIAILRREH